MRRFIFAFLVIGFAVSASQAEPALKKEVELLQIAFDRRFNFDLVQVVELYAHSEMGELRRTLQMATKRVDGSLHGLAHFMAPAELRGTRMLMIERFDRNDDFFLFVPTLKKIRRVSSAQRADVFMGTDLTYEDFERRYVDDYDVSMVGTTTIQGEDVYAIRCEPRYESGHKHAIYYVAKSDQAILEIRYFRANRDKPVKVQRISREKMVTLDGHIVPTGLWVENLLRDTKTDVRFSQIRINPVVDDRLFSTSALEVGRRIPYLER
jgi:hypothetical protein